MPPTHQEMSASSLRVIGLSQTNFSQEAKDLANHLMNAKIPKSFGGAVFTRADFTDAINGDLPALSRMRLYAVRTEALSSLDTSLLSEALEWIELLRTVGGGQRLA